MQKILIYLVLIAVIAIVVVIFQRLTAGEPIYPYQKKKYFLTLTERKFFEALLQILNNQYFIFPQVHIASIVEVKKGQPNYMAYFNKIIRKSFDFVIFDKQNLNVLLVIELDDKTHDRPDRMERDNFVNKSLEAAGLRILHVKPQAAYNMPELAKEINKVLNPAQAAAVVSSSELRI